MSVLDILLKKNLLGKAEAAAVKGKQAEGDTLDEALISVGVRPEDILLARGEFLGIPTRAVAEGSVPFEVLDYIPEESATHYQFVPIGFKDGMLEVGVVDPDNIEARDALNFIAAKKNIPYKIFLISPDDFQKVIESYKGIGGEVSKALTELESELSVDVGDSASTRPSRQDRRQDRRIHHRGRAGRQDRRHHRPLCDGRQRFRRPYRAHARQGPRPFPRRRRAQHAASSCRRRSIRAVVARIKVLSNMKLDEKRKPQDGRFSARIDGRKIDFRVSTFPAYYGEKVEMRILDQEKGVKKLDELGMSPKNLALVREAIDRPYGLILITGPTGSGKSTTLYSMLNEVDKESY